MVIFKPMKIPASLAHVLEAETTMFHVGKQTYVFAITALNQAVQDVVVV